MRIKFGKTKTVLLAISACMFSVNAFAAECNEQALFSDMCVSNKVVECMKRYSPESGNFSYSWEYLTYAYSTLDADSPVLDTTYGYTPVSCAGQQKFSAALLPRKLSVGAAFGKPARG